MKKKHFKELVANNKKELLNDKKELEKIYNKVDSKLAK